ncbi:MAG: polysaccharide deacetylase family protein [Acidobacteriota bacterium]|nr:polysaccharide deacetylase family protein [Acidobacteriota bacterium]
MQKIPVLTYHSIDESSSVISTGAATFRGQMKFLKEADFNVISLSNLIKNFSENKKLPAKTIVLTFDDGFQNFYATAFPVLAECGFTATVFLVADHCEKYNDWDGNLPTIELSRLMTWNEIKELHHHGIEFGAHSLTHPDLTKIPLEQVRRELGESKTVIEDKLGSAVETFAYPYGKFNAAVKRLTEQNYAAACSTNLGKVQERSDFYSLERVDTYYLKNERIFKSLESFSFDRYLQLRQAMRNLKQLFV